MAPVNPARAKLAARLRQMRAATGLSGNRFAQRLGWHQSRVSKIETGAQMPSDDDLRAWISATGQGADTQAELLAMAATVRFDQSSVRDVVDHGELGVWQFHFAALEADAAYIAEYQAAFVPGLVQTAAYARELLHLHGGPVAAGASEPDIEALVGERIRRQEILYQSGKHIQLVIGEAALHDPPGSIDTLTGQLDRLVAVAGLATVDLAVLPIGTRMPILPLGSFVLHDNRTVFVETITSLRRLNEPDEVEIYVTAFGLLRDAAATGPEAVTLIRRVMHELAAEQP
ncbi:MAG: helix-turn-helix domain-containing protein [Pseudonocardiaceae bacterium]